MLTLPISVHDFDARIVTPALALLPAAMDSPEARVLLAAIALQESNLGSRWQVLDGGGKGPARGLLQFERGGGCVAVLMNQSSRYWMVMACRARGVKPLARDLWLALESDDILAVIAARLLLFTDPARLPGVRETNTAWSYYIRNWRPGKPHPDRWPQNHRRAQEVA